MATLFDRSIVYDPETRDFAMYLDGQLVGFARTYAQGELELNELVYSLLVRDYVAEADERAERAAVTLLQHSQGSDQGC